MHIFGHLFSSQDISLPVREQDSVTSGKWLFLTLSCVAEKEKVQTVDFCIPRKGFLKDLGINLFLSFFFIFLPDKINTTENMHAHFCFM